MPQPRGVFCGGRSAVRERRASTKYELKHREIGNFPIGRLLGPDVEPVFCDHYDSTTLAVKYNRAFFFCQEIASGIPLINFYTNNKHLNRSNFVHAMDVYTNPVSIKEWFAVNSAVGNFIRRTNILH